MPTYSVSEAKDNLSKLIDQAAAGQEVIITRHGKEAARLSGPLAESAPFSKKRSQEWLEEIDRLRESLPKLDGSWADELNYQDDVVFKQRFG
jgi:prevent-host-death family protein